MRLFQFHKGTIRTPDRYELANPSVNFNSIKVRLEQSVGEPSDGEPSEFQFHKGTIRTIAYSHNSLRDNNFNSIKVRLERSFFITLTYDSEISIP